LCASSWLNSEKKSSWNDCDGIFQLPVDTDFLLLFTFLTVSVNYVATWFYLELRRTFTFSNDFHRRSRLRLLWHKFPARMALDNLSVATWGRCSQFLYD